MEHIRRSLTCVNPDYGWHRKYSFFCASILLLLFFFTFFTTNAHAATFVSGTISNDTTWTAANSPYVLTGNVTVNTGYTLTIEPGVVVKPKQTNTGLIINGTLNATGVTFTSYKDDFHGGDTNLDGSISWPLPGDWYQIYGTSD